MNNYKIASKYAEVTITANDIDENCTEENIYEYMPKEVKDFYYKNKNKSNFRETRISGRCSPDTPFTEKGIDGITFIFELT